MKKKVVAIWLSHVLLIATYAQNNPTIDLKPFLFGKFIDGMVLLKSGVIEKVPLNYNTDNQSIYFINDGQYMQVTGLETIDTVYIQQKKFIPLHHAFYEVMAQTPGTALLLSYTNKPRPMISTTDHNGTSKQSANVVSNTVSDTYVGRNFKGDYEIELMKHYWLMKGNKLTRIDNKKQFVKWFPTAVQAAIEKYIDTNAIDFNRDTDLIQLYTYSLAAG